MIFTVSEFGRIWSAPESRQLSDGNLELEAKPFNALKSLLETGSDESDTQEQFFRFEMRQGRECLRVMNYVGVIQAGAVQVEVLPKLSRQLDVSSSRQLLVKMLAALDNAPFKESSHADLNVHQMPLFEVVYRYFLQETASVVRKGLARAYVRQEGNLQFLRGKLNIAQNIKANAGLSSQIYCEYDEYEHDRPANRLLAAALELGIRQSNSTDNQQLARELRFHFASVPISKNYRADAKAILEDRSINHYKQALALAYLILFQMNPLTQAGSNKATALLFPMETVFESYVAKKLREQNPKWRIQTQTKRRYLVEEHVGRRMFALRPDLLIDTGRQKVVADTKWKLIDQSDVKGKYGISQSDMYQLYAYGKKFLGDQTAPTVIMIYPKSDQFEQEIPAIWYEADKLRLLVTSFDVDSDTWNTTFCLEQQ